MGEARAKRLDTKQVLGDERLEHYSSRLHSYLLSRLRYPQDTQDLTQEIFSRFIRKCQDDPDSVRDPLRFLFGIAANVIKESNYDARHTRVTFDSTLVEHAEDIDGPEVLFRYSRRNTAEQVEIREDIQHALAQLPEHYLIAWQLVDVEGMSYEEAAQASKFARATVSAYVTRARAKLRLILKDYWHSKKGRK